MLTVSAREAGQRFDKFLKKYLNAAPPSFIYKMLRKKNIKLNGRKAEGSELLREGDEVALYFREETFGEFRKEEAAKGTVLAAAPGLRESDGRNCFPSRADAALPIIYEDEDIVAVNKPAGLLSQAGSPTDRSVAEILPELLLERGSVTREDLRTFHPSPLNRLDRNTSGLLLCGKSVRGAQLLSALLKTRELKKEYLAVTFGAPSEGEYLAYQVKDFKGNRVSVTDEPVRYSREMRTGIRVISRSGEFALLGVDLITGRTHQIRAHLAHLGYPVLGDPKYGDAELNLKIREKYGIGRQLLHAWRVLFPERAGELPQLDGLVIKAPPPEDMAALIRLSDLE